MNTMYRSMVVVLVFIVLWLSVGSVGIAETEPMRDIPILIMLSEQQAPNGKEYKWWSAYPYGRMWFASQAIANQLEQHSFFVFDPDKHNLPDISDIGINLSNMQSLSKEDLKKIANKMNAKLMIVGTAKVEVKDFFNNGSAVIVEANVSVKVYSIKSNSWIAAAQKKSMATYPLMDYASAFALKSAGDLVGISLSNALSLHPDIKTMRQR